MEKLKLLDPENSRLRMKEVLSSYLCTHFQQRTDSINVLEAGCGKSWALYLKDISLQLTGVDITREAIETRRSNEQDLARAIVGDLLTVQLGCEEFDMVYCCNVLEHISGAEEVVEKFFEWLKPDGLLVLVFPDRDSAAGFLTRITPHWVHVAFYRYKAQCPWAGKPGQGPFPTCFDRIVSRRAIHEYCRVHAHNILLEYGRPYTWKKPKRLAPALSALFKSVQILSFGKLSADHGGLVYVIQKGKQPETHACSANRGK